MPSACVEMNIATRLFTSSLGRKYIMAITGMSLLGFVIGHLLGNLQIFLGADVINRYGHFLQSNPEIIWPARIGLLAAVLLHIWSAVKLSAENKAARPVPYGNWNPTAAIYASRTMLMSRLIIAAFIIYHLLHFTVQTQQINLTGVDFVKLVDEQGRHDVYKMMILGFRQPLVSLFYLVAMALLALHLRHGASAMFQSLGWKKKSYAGLIDGFAKGMAVFIFVGYASIPVAILLGYGKEIVK